MSRLSVFDAGFLAFESAATPMHVGGLQLFSYPDGADESYLHDLINQARDVEDFRYPFNRKPVNRFGQWRWEEDNHFDIDYHVRHSALPAPGRYREMFELVSRLHGSLLDRSRPLWEANLIEGLETNQFALYTKVHHSIVDGLGAMKLLRAMTSEDEDERGLRMAFAADRNKPKKSSRKLAPPRVSKGALQDFSDSLQAQFGVASGATTALRKHLHATFHPDETALVGFAQGPKSVINGKVYSARRVVAQSFSIERIQRVAKAYNATLNDIVLAMSSGSLRTHLYMNHVLPEKPLITMAPVGLKSRGGEGGADDAVGNAVGMILINLATNVGDPIERLHAIQASVKESKAMLQAMSKEEILAVAAVTGAPWAMLSLMGLADKVTPNFNVTVSNVPGPKNRLYWNGARMDGMYPISIVTHGMALNYTITSYAGSLDFGVTACRRSVPKAQRLIDYLEQALVELEQAADLK